MTAPRPAPSAEARRLIDELRDRAFAGGGRDRWGESYDADLALSDHVAGLEAEVARLRDLLRPGTPAHGRARHALAEVAMQDGPWSRGELPASWRYEHDTDAFRASYLAYADRVLALVADAAQETMETPHA